MQLNRLKMAIQYRQKKVSRKLVIFHYFYSKKKILLMWGKYFLGYQDEIIRWFCQMNQVLRLVDIHICNNKISQTTRCIFCRISQEKSELKLV